MDHIYDDRTPNKNLPMPHPDNFQEHDIPRIRQAFYEIDALLNQVSDVVVSLIDDASSSGNRTWSAQHIADRIAQLGESLGTAAGRDLVAGVSDRTPNRVPVVSWMGLGPTSLVYDDAVMTTRQKLESLPVSAFYRHIQGTSSIIRVQALDIYGAIEIPLSGPVIVHSGYPHGGTYVARRLYDNTNTLDIGPTKESARTALGITDGNKVVDLGAKGSGSHTVTCDTAAAKIFSTNFTSSNGTVTFDFTNLPEQADEVQTWHLQILGGGLKTLAFRLSGAAFTPVWSGGVAPTLSSSTAQRSVLLFERWPNSTSIYAMLVDASAV